MFSALADSLLMYLFPSLGSVFGGIIHSLILHSHRMVAIMSNDSALYLQWSPGYQVLSLNNIVHT